MGLGRVEAGSVDLAFADPPFNIGYDYDVYDDRCEAEKYLDWSRKWGRAVHRALKPTGTFWLAIGDEYAAELKLIFQNEIGFTCRSWVIWYYTFGVNCTKKFSRSHAHLFHFVKDPKRFTFNNDSIRVPSARQLVYGDSRADKNGRLPDDTWILRPQDLPEGFQPDEDTWYFSRVCGTFKERAGWHGCQMPEQLLGRIIRACSNENDLVLDPFAGSGTTLVVAKKLGRRWLGFELSKSYADKVKARLDAAEVGQPLEGAEEPKVSAPRTPGRRAGVERLGVMPSVTRTLDEPIEVKRAISEAYITVRQGEYPIDRVVADPELNRSFQEVCNRLGIPGQATDWNRQLFNLRKASWFKGLPRSKRFPIDRDEADRHGYACEIALEQLRNCGRTLDEVLCDPEKVAEFDRLVNSMLPQPLSSFNLRWLALSIRKRADRIRVRGTKVRPSAKNLLSRSSQLSSKTWQLLPPLPGLYWLESEAKRLYIGETLNLQRRLEVQLGASKFDFWGTDLHEISIRYHPLPDLSNLELQANQSWWIAKWKPIGNLLDLAAA